MRNKARGTVAKPDIDETGAANIATRIIYVPKEAAPQLRRLGRGGGKRPPKHDTTGARALALTLEQRL